LSDAVGAAAENYDTAFWFLYVLALAVFTAF
jgi:hypothetical protein